MPGPSPNLISATWTTAFSGELWKKLDGLKRGASKDGDFLILGPTLPDGDDDRTAEVVVHRHEQEDELHWGMTVEARPPGEPPDPMREHDAKLGGRRGLSSVLAEALSSGVPPVGSFRARCFVPGESYRCTVVPAVVERGGPHGSATRLGQARLEQVGYRFESGVSGLEEIVIVYLHSPDKYSLSVSAKGPLKLGSPRWLPFADDITELAWITFFLPKGVAQ